MAGNPVAACAVFTGRNWIVFCDNSAHSLLDSGLRRNDGEGDERSSEISPALGPEKKHAREGRVFR
jgi:hypothetical protein